MRLTDDTAGYGGGSRRLRIAIVGSGISGASAAWALHSAHDVTLYEQNSEAGGHTATKIVDHGGTPVAVDTGFIVFNTLTYPDFTAMLAHLGVATHDTNMSFSMSLDGGRLEWCGDSLSTIFAQKRNLLSPAFLWMLREILRFNRQCVADRDAGRLAGVSIGDYLSARRFSDRFRNDYLVPMAAAIWSTPRVQILDFPAETFVTFFDNHRLIHMERPIWRTVTGGSKNYLDRLLAPLAGRIRLATTVASVTRAPGAVFVTDTRGHTERFDRIIMAGHSDQTLRALADPSDEERAILSAVRYQPNRVVLHRDETFMPRRRAAWAAWNYHRNSVSRDDETVAVTYWMNRLQGIDQRYPLFVTLNGAREPAKGTVFGEWTYEHPLFDAAAIAAQGRLPAIQGVRNTWYAGAWTRYGFHEDGLRSGLAAAEANGAMVPWRAQPAFVEAAE